VTISTRLNITTLASNHANRHHNLQPWALVTEGTSTLPQTRHLLRMLQVSSTEHRVGARFSPQPTAHLYRLTISRPSSAQASSHENDMGKSFQHR